MLRVAEIAKAGVVITLAALAGNAPGVDFTVTSLDDSGAGTLREGIAAGTYSDIYFDPSLVSGGPATISLTTKDANAPTSAFCITSPLNIHGLADLTVSGNDTFRLLTVYNTSLSISDLTISGFRAQGGTAPYMERYSGGGGALGAGGAIFANQSALTIDSVIFSGNTAQGGNGGSGGGSSTTVSGEGPGGGGMGGSSTSSTGGPANDPTGIGAGADGGGSSLPQPGGFGGGGGGRRGMASYAGGPGGFGGGGGGGAKTGPDNGGPGGFGAGDGGAGDNNHGGGGGGAGMGGAIFMLGGTADITDSQFTGNYANKGIGSGYVNGQDGQGLGGAIFNCNGELTVTNGAFSSNTAAEGANGIYGYAGDVNVTGVGATGLVKLINTPDVTLNDTDGKRNSTDMVWIEMSATTGDLTIKKFFDCDEDGAYNGADKYLAGWQFNVSNAAHGGSYNQNHTTDANGEINLTGLDAGDYDVTETPKGTGWLLTAGTNPRTVAVTAGSLVTTSFANQLPGDANQDEKVNLADFTVLKANFGENPAAWTDGNFNDDMIANLADFTILKAHFGEGAPSAGGVPEPASAMLLLTISLALLRRKRGK